MQPAVYLQSANTDEEEEVSRATATITGVGYTYAGYVA